MYFYRFCNVFLNNVYDSASFFSAGPILFIMLIALSVSCSRGKVGKVRAASLLEQPSGGTEIPECRIHGCPGVNCIVEAVLWLSLDVRISFSMVFSESTITITRVG